MTSWKVLFVTVALTPAAWGSAYKMASAVSKSERALYQNAIDSTIPVHFPEQKCSAVYVGRTGEALTNLHCIEPCLLENEATLLTTEKLTEKNVELKKPTEKVIGHRCPLRFGKKFVVGDAEILAIFGPGWVAPREVLSLMALFAPESMIEVMKMGFEGKGDLALVRLRPGQGEATRMPSPACAQLSEDTRDPLPNVLGLAYPLLARKTENPFSPLMTMGTTLMWTRGEMTRDLNAYLKFSQLAEDQASLPWMFPGGTMMGSIDGERGASGSPVFDENGKVAAIVRSTWKALGTDYIAWRTQAIDLGSHRQPLTKILGSDICH